MSLIVYPDGIDTVIALPAVPVPVAKILIHRYIVFPTTMYLAVLTFLAMFEDAPCASVGVYEVSEVFTGKAAAKLSRTFAFQNAAVSTSPVGVEGKRRGRCVGYHSAYE